MGGKIKRRGKNLISGPVNCTGPFIPGQTPETAGRPTATIFTNSSYSGFGDCQQGQFVPFFCLSVNGGFAPLTVQYAI